MPPPDTCARAGARIESINADTSSALVPHLPSPLHPPQASLRACLVDAEQRSPDMDASTRRKLPRPIHRTLNVAYRLPALLRPALWLGLAEKSGRLAWDETAAATATMNAPAFCTRTRTSPRIDVVSPTPRVGESKLTGWLHHPATTTTIAKPAACMTDCADPSSQPSPSHAPALVLQCPRLRALKSTAHSPSSPAHADSIGEDVFLVVPPAFEARVAPPTQG
ncbi:hypothetical protein C8R47DRAFT_1206765 [Mycena vitilis]|nr:hypothetical protein C8R47DRAFT_1206765 [Mycena vitilis]